MNALQFKKLKIGDRILTYNGACTTVTDIDRMAGKLTCGNGQWRDYHRVRMAVETDLLVEHKRVQDYVPPDTVILSRALLLKLGFSKVCILRAIENCGPDGFLGTLQDLFCQNGIYLYRICAESCSGNDKGRTDTKKGCKTWLVQADY